MATPINPTITLQRVFYKREVVQGEQDPDVARITGSKPETRKKFFRTRKRIYLDDIISIEEYKYDEFAEFTKAPLTYVEYAGDYFIAEIDFEVLKNILDEHDKNKSIIINN